jgi:uncharacterized membrane protein (DUF106 family)
MSFVNAVLRPLFDGLLWPFRELPPWVGLTVVSLVTAVAALLVFKATSRQDSIAAVKRKIHACLFEMRLFNDDFRAILRAQGEILRHNVRYVSLSLVPMLWMIVPLMLAFAQMQFHYGYRGLAPGEPALLEVELREAAADAARASATRPDASLELPAGLTEETSALWMPAAGRIAWRISAVSPGDYEAIIHLDGETYTKSVRSSDAVVRRSPIRVSAGFVDQLLYPAEPPLSSDGPVAAITVAYPEAEVSLLGVGMPWWLAWLILITVFALALRNRMGVQI